TIFSTGSEDTIRAAITQQFKIGEIHARVAIPVHLVLRGARHLKECFHQIVHNSGRYAADELIAAMAFISNTIDFAMEIMSHAYASSYERQSRAEENYRLFAVTQNMATEKDRQRAALLEWENQLIFGQAVGLLVGQLPR